MNYRSKSDYEPFQQYTTALDKQKPNTAGSASPKSKMISNTSELHHKPTGMMVSPSGERITCALDNNLETPIDLKDTNPFSSTCYKIHDSESDDNFVAKLPSKKEKSRQMRRKIQAKDKRKAERIILTQKFVTARRQPKNVSVQTDASMSLIKFPETIGDGEQLSRSCIELMPSTRMEIDSGKFTSKQYLSENQRKFLSFLLMIILIFWLTSIILDVEIPAEFCRIILNYIVYSYQEKPQTFFEKCWECIQKIFD